MSDRYDTSSNSEGQYQPGSNELVLLNKLEIIDPMEMNDIELDLLTQLTSSIFDEIADDQTTPLMIYASGIDVG